MIVLLINFVLKNSLVHIALLTSLLVSSYGHFDVLIILRSVFK